MGTVGGSRSAIGSEPTGSGASPDPIGSPEYLVVGRIGRPHGVRGEVRVDVQTDFPELRFHPGAELLIGRDQSELESTRVRTARGHQSALLVHFDGIDDRDEAQALAGLLVWIRIADAAELPAGSYYEHELIGLEVVLADGSRVGAVSAIMETGAADVLVIKGPSGDQLVPMIRTVIVNVDRDARRILISPPPGLLD